jgi:RNA polymerase sigma-70 factor (sigma-E family)
MADRSPPPGFREFVLARSSALYQTALLLTRDPHDAQDLVQEALARTWRSWARIDDQPEAYVRTIIVRHYLTSRRRRWHGEHPTEHLPERPVHERLHSGPVDPASTVPLSSTLADAVGALPPRQRAVVVLRYYHDYTEARTAATLGVTQGTVKSQHGKALAALRISSHLTDGEHDPVTAEGRGQR